MANDRHESVSDDELSAEQAALHDAASAGEMRDEMRDERRDDLAALSADERDRAQWDEGAPACLAGVEFARRMQRRLQAQAHVQAHVQAHEPR